MMMHIEQNAPLTARQEIFVEAPVDTVWALQTDLEHWPDWQPGVSSVTLEGTLAPGSVFRWKASGMNITSTLRLVEPPKRIGWTGDSLGMRAVHIWHFEPEGNGTRVVSEESLSGWLARLIRLFSPGFLEKSMASSLETLKKRAEQRGAG